MIVSEDLKKQFFRQKVGPDRMIRPLGPPYPIYLLNIYLSSSTAQVLPLNIYSSTSTAQVLVPGAPPHFIAQILTLPQGKRAILLPDGI